MSAERGIEVSFEHHGASCKVSDIKVELNNATFNGIEKRMMQGLIGAAYEIRDKAHAYAPWKTGALKNSIRVEPPDNNSVDVVAGGGFYAGDDGVTKYIGYAYKREIGPNRFAWTEHYMEHGARDVLQAGGGSYVRNKYFKF